jgi:2-desacetyl-2-hydroxyethyl bacteriochlorophyllide A dehydrogenase
MIRSVELRRPNELVLVERDRDVLEPQAVRLCVDACGICGSDVTSYHTGHYVLQDQVMGHEIVATVVEVGGTVLAPISVGDRMMVRPLRTCGRCWYCRRGDIHLCGASARLSLAYGLPGGYADEVVVSDVDLDPTCLMPVAEGIPAEEALWAEPLAVALHAVALSGLGAGDDVAVIGCGSIGLSVVAAAVAHGASVTVIEPRAKRRELASKLGAGVAAPPGEIERDFTVVLDSSGATAGVAEGERLLDRGGLLVLIGASDALLHDGLDASVRGSFGYRALDFVRSAALINSGRTGLRHTVTHRFGLDDVPSALRAVRDDPNAGKVAIFP